MLVDYLTVSTHLLTGSLITSPVINLSATSITSSQNLASTIMALFEELIEAATRVQVLQNLQGIVFVLLGFRPVINVIASRVCHNSMVGPFIDIRRRGVY